MITICACNTKSQPGFETKQKEATIEFVSRKDVFILLPTGYGKSVYYATIPLIFDQLRGNIGSVVVVVSPLIALMKDQVESFKRAKDWKLHF